jgi:hypothetical protein
MVANFPVRWLHWKAINTDKNLLSNILLKTIQFSIFLWHTHPWHTTLSGSCQFLFKCRTLYTPVQVPVGTQTLISDHAVPPWNRNFFKHAKVRRNKYWSRLYVSWTREIVSYRYIINSVPLVSVAHTEVEPRCYITEPVEREPCHVWVQWPLTVPR